MSQSVVTIRLNGQPYQIGCGAGEEPRVEKLGYEVESVMQSLVASVGQIGEARLLAMTALILADRVGTISPSSEVTGKTSDDAAAEIIEKAAQRIAELATKLASTGVKP